MVKRRVVGLISTTFALGRPMPSPRPPGADLHGGDSFGGAGDETGEITRFGFVDSFGFAGAVSDENIDGYFVTAIDFVAIFATQHLLSH